MPILYGYRLKKQNLRQISTQQPSSEIRSDADFLHEWCEDSQCFSDCFLCKRKIPAIFQRNFLALFQGLLEILLCLSDSRISINIGRTFKMKMEAPIIEID